MKNKLLLATSLAILSNISVAQDKFDTDGNNNLPISY